MKNYLLFYVLLILVFSSCNDEDDPASLSYLDGTYELVTENTDNGLWFARQIIFHSDGSLESQVLVRESEKGEDLGLMYYMSGTYQLRGDEYQEFLEEVYVIDYEELDVVYVATKDELSVINDFSRKSEVGVLKRMDNGARISILFPCNDIIVMASMCIGEQEYERVN